MLITTITNRKKPFVYQHPAPVVIPNTPQPYVSNMAIYNEAKRRNAIIKDLVKNFKHKKGDKLICSNVDDVARWGECTLISIVDDYQHMEKDHKWPPNDNPMIITAAAENGEIFFATTNYFKEGVNEA